MHASYVSRQASAKMSTQAGLWTPPLHGPQHPIPHLYPADLPPAILPTYRLQLSVLVDREARSDCPPRSFSFSTPQLLTAAVDDIDLVFGSGDAFSEYTVTKSGGVDAPRAVAGSFGPGVSDGDAPESGDGEAPERVEGGRTEMLVIGYDSITADESWNEFLARLHTVESGWER